MCDAETDAAALTLGLLATLPYLAKGHALALCLVVELRCALARTGQRPCRSPSRCLTHVLGSADSGNEQRGHGNDRRGSLQQVSRKQNEHTA